MVFNKVFVKIVKKVFMILKMLAFAEPLRPSYRDGFKTYMALK